MIGELAINNKLCSYFTKKPEFLTNLQSYLLYGSEQIKLSVLWNLSNIICNSQSDLELVLNSGLISNVSIAARSGISTL